MKISREVHFHTAREYIIHHRYKQQAFSASLPFPIPAYEPAGAEELADANGWTPLFGAARYTKYPGVIGVLLDAGHNPKARSYDMARPIEHANMNPSLMNTEELLRLEKESR